MQVIVDTGVWSLALRRPRGQINDGERRLVAILGDLIRYERARVVGPIRQELLSGIKEAAQYEKLREYLRAFADVPLTTADYEEAARCSNQCRSRGITGSSIDFLICAVSLARDWLILTTDADFKSYAKVIPIKIHMPAPVA